ncbi:MAG TPA: hypothetical protein VLF94_07810 [Chlamydiales bacterium]|nr:hypothetical protein [Chlamydiales bacterium]
MSGEETAGIRSAMDAIILSQKHLELRSTVNCMTAEERVDALHRAEIGDWSSRLYHDEMSIKDKVQLKRAIEKFPAGSEIERIASSLVTKAMSVEDRLSILDAVAALPAKEPNIIKYIKYSLITESMSASDIVLLLNAVAKLPAERFSSGSNMRNLIGSAIDTGGVAQILNAVADLHPDEQEMIPTYALGLITKSMNAEDRVLILKAVAALPPLEREAICKCTSEEIVKIYSSLNAEETVLILKAVAAIPPQKRQAALGNAGETEQLIKRMLAGNRAKLLNIDPRELDLAYKKGVALQEQIALLRQSKEPDWQEKAMQLIRQSRFEEPILEKQRLKGAGAVDEDKITKALEKSPLLENEKAEIILGQALEIKQLYGETHYVFTHGQSHSGYLLSLIYKAQAKQAGKNTKHFKLLRPHTLHEQTASVEEYSKGGGMDHSVMDHDLLVRENLLSCSGNLYCNAPGESAISFFASDQSMGSINALLEKQIGQSASDQLISAIPESRSPGNLYVVCIPKEQWTQAAYRCHPGGEPCTCKTKLDPTTLLQKAQEGEKTLECENRGSQYRVDLRNLKQGSKIYALTPFTKPERKQMKASVEALLHP